MSTACREKEERDREKKKSIESERRVQVSFVCHRLSRSSRKSPSHRDSSEGWIVTDEQIALEVNATALIPICGEREQSGERERDLADPSRTTAAPRRSFPLLVAFKSNKSRLSRATSDLSLSRIF